MSKTFDVLALCYSQTGRTAEALEVLLGPLRARSDVRLDEVRIEPVEPFPYPWPLARIWSTFPEVVCEEPIALKPTVLDGAHRYDLILLGCQVWFLSCSLPVSSFLNGPQSGVFADTPVVSVLTYRKAWAEGLRSVRAHVDRLGGRVVGEVVMRAEDLVALPVLSWKRPEGIPAPEKEWRYDSGERALVERMGRQLAEALPRLGETDGEPVFSESSSVFRPERREAMTFVERMIERHEGAQKRRYLRWGRVIKRRSEPMTRLRFAWLLVCAPLFVPPIYWPAPFVMLFQWARKLFRRG